MQLRAKTLTDGGMTLKSDHRDRFALFPKLLFEIRTMIWDQICEEPRIVEVEVHSYPNPQYIPKISDPVDLGFTPQEPVPALLHVCNEARHQGLKRYTRGLQRQVDVDHVADSIIYMSLENDTLLILPPKMQPTDENFYRSIHTIFFQERNRGAKVWSNNSTGGHTNATNR